MTVILKIMFLVLSYLLGSIPFGYIIGKIKGHDLRKEGSGNIGATNAGRILGKKYAILTYVLDFCKGFCFVFLFRYLIIPYKYCVLNPMLYGFIAVIGHSYSIFLRFDGGKSVSCGCGAICGYFYHFFVPIMVMFFVLKKATKLVSLSSLLTALFAFTISLSSSLIRNDFFEMEIKNYYPLNYWFLIFVFLILLVIFLKHKNNIVRIIKNEETAINY